MKRKFSLLLVACSIFSFAQVEENKLDELIQNTLKTFDVPGMSVGIVKDGQVLPLGWVREDGELSLQADWYKVPYSEKQFTDKISQLHAKYQVMDVCEDNRWSVDDVVVNEQGEIEILASSFA